ncbi:MAG TPA: hypothetical protein EYQ24_01095 [Bacteroidetes bacterium]|nr:hypothetical protein [Bacteroidota bacterium]HIL56558.1 hypothetical protein [Rhodothermales bacterium]
MTHPPPIVARMHSHVERWTACADDRALFLRCYSMMTGNVFATAEGDGFGDRDWVVRLLHRFADYYFDGLDAFERAPESAPAVWRQAHRLAADPDAAPIQKLLLGVNAHINYDLVLTLVDLLEPEWGALSPEARGGRYEDHCRINDVIGRTIDAVQDEVVEPAMPFMAYVDRWLGPLDEALVSGVITRWREGVWRHAVAVLDAPTTASRDQLVRRVEAEALRTGGLVCPRARHL